MEGFQHGCVQRGLAPKAPEGLPGFPGTRGDGGRREKERDVARTEVEFHFCLHFLAESRTVFPDWRPGSVAVSLGTWGSRVASLVSASSSVKARGHFCPPVVHALCCTDTDGLLAELTSSSSGSVPVCPQHPFYSRDTFLCPPRWPSSDAAGTSIRRNRRASAECF